MLFGHFVSRTARKKNRIYVKVTPVGTLKFSPDLSVSVQADYKRLHTLGSVHIR